MTSSEIRYAFLSFFKDKDHRLVPSAPMVVKNDPSLMFTNAGMNQFKDIFLGNREGEFKRVADTQKCLRVSGKHNDLEEVGHDTYHHTMFEMLGNWSFGDYFKSEAVDFAWEFLTGKMKIPAGRIYATVFEGDEADGLEWDSKAFEHWRRYMDESRILKGSKKDNFWEMGETGPCGPCSEIHIDLRPDEERTRQDGRELVNRDHPLVLELWNLVFIQYNRKADGSLEDLPSKHIDTGLGFERLCMVLQGKLSNYDTDLFQPIIAKIAELSDKPYGENEATDTAMRVVSDHLRAVAFSIADGQIPSNTGAGYVIRRILRRAVRYGYTFLGLSDAFICRLVTVLAETMGESFPELQQQQDTIIKVIREEENSFLRTLETGIGMLDKLMADARAEKKDSIAGREAFILYDTYGFPFDLTRLILRENEMRVSQEEFEAEMAKQKERSRDAAAVTSGDWIVIADAGDTKFTGYDSMETRVKILRYRTVKQKSKELYQLVLDRTPFYAESGGQVGDTGILENGNEKIRIIDTQKENELILHLADRLPDKPGEVFIARVSETARLDTAANHSSTHLLHHALRKVLGEHVEQKGSLVHPEYLRFDFSHFRKVSPEELRKIESMVNALIRANIPVDEKRNVSMEEATKMGALAFFGEKYGEQVRVISFGDSVELCGGTHVRATGDIGFFKIIRESAIAAGIRRIEARSGRGAEEFVYLQEDILKKIESFVKSPDLSGTIEKLLSENSQLKKQLSVFENQIREAAKKDLLSKMRQAGGVNVIAEQVMIQSAENIKNLSFELKNQVPDLFLILGSEIKGKAHLSLMISEKLVEEKGMDAIKIIREISSLIKGGGGGQAFYATAGGKDPAGIQGAIDAALKFVE